MTKVWFLLYDGSSPDGRGNPHYKGRTENPLEALAHLSKVANNPYSTGCVKAFTDDTYEYFSCEIDIKRFVELMRGFEDDQE